MNMMGSVEQLAPRVITGLVDIIDKRSNPRKTSPAKGSAMPTVNGLNSSTHNVGRSKSPPKVSTIDGSSKLRNSPVVNPRSASRDGNSSKNVNGARAVPMPFTGEDTTQDRMNSLLKSPIKNNLQMVPVRNGKTGSAKM
jgi:hypothetical protein